MLVYPLTDAPLVLRKIAELFSKDEKYSEKEVNAIIQGALDDYLTRGTKMMLERFPIIEERKVFQKISELFSEDDKHSKKEVNAIIKVVLDDYFVSICATNKAKIPYDGESVLQKIYGLFSTDNKYSEKEINAIIKGALDDYVEGGSIDEIYSIYLSAITENDRVLEQIATLSSSSSRQVATLFSKDEKYSEKQVNAIIKRALNDYVSIRSYLVAFGLLSRMRNCSEYWVKTIPKNSVEYKLSEQRWNNLK